MPHVIAIHIYEKLLIASIRFLRKQINNLLSSIFNEIGIRMLFGNKGHFKNNIGNFWVLIFTVQTIYKCCCIHFVIPELQCQNNRR